MESERHRFGPGIYLHFPFCHSRCGYCDFFVVLGDRSAQRSFCDDLLREIDLVSCDARFQERPFQTIFLGGGTPSLLEASDLDEILVRLRSSFPFTSDPEITIECNPESLNPEKMVGYREAGVTRFSLGVQSLDLDQLALLDRRHGIDEVRQRVEELRSLGQRDVSLDLIYGLPNAEVATWETTLAAALDLAPTHLSAYLLSLEPHVPLARRLSKDHSLELPTDDSAATQFRILKERARSKGLLQYEISNFALPGEESLHNQNYWARGDYLGLGPSAHSHEKGVRWSNVRSLKTYGSEIAAGRLPRENREEIDRLGRLAERVFLGLRLSTGLSRTDLTAELTDTEIERLFAVCGRLSDEGWVDWRDGRLCLTEEAQFVSNAVFTELLADF